MVIFHLKENYNLNKIIKFFIFNIFKVRYFLNF
jgi:hypothetical protein